MRYGAVPVVRETGGLRDTVTQFNKYTGTGNGYVFNHYNAHDFMRAIRKALRARGTYNFWMKLVANAMESDFSWQASAREYKDLYQAVLTK